MSRVGKAPIPVPSEAKVEIQGSQVKVTGPKGSLEHTLPPEIHAAQEGSELRFTRTNEQKRIKSLHGLHKTIVFNMIKGVTEGFSKGLELSGVGYRAQVTGSTIELFVGFSHPVAYTLPTGIIAETPKPTQVVIRGMDKCIVGQVAARLRAFAPPEPYKGKGIRYSDEVIRRKAGKAVA